MTILFESPIFGPVKSRRLGVSLGVNLLPSNGKVCTFDCIYCECGLKKDRQSEEKLPSRELVKQRLEKKLIEMREEKSTLDVITFAGNGEPTLHPHFSGIIDDTINLRNSYYPQAKISVLSNASLIHKEEVFNALLLVDNNILKLDTVDLDYIAKVDQPNSNFSLERTIAYLKKFGSNCIIQTMFLDGECRGESVLNTTDKYVLPWLDVVERIKPREVMIYTIERETPYKELKKASSEALDAIAQQLRSRGLKVTVSY